MSDRSSVPSRSTTSTGRAATSAEGVWASGPVSSGGGASGLIPYKTWRRRCPSARDLASAFCLICLIWLHLVSTARVLLAIVASVYFTKELSFMSLSFSVRSLIVGSILAMGTNGALAQ
ncbi:MAG TPA: hypothetical protein EYP31_04715, partial [Roseibacterium sp.]|nr:hypothetical protein [Roseibacterium sp.]